LGGTRDDVQSWVIELHERGYEPETIRGHHDLMAAMMRRAAEEGLIAKSPCRSIELPAVTAREKRYLTEDEVERLVEACEPRHKALVYAAAYLGLRWQEIAGLRREALDIRPWKACVGARGDHYRARQRPLPRDRVRQEQGGSTARSRCPSS
jgi:integrase